MELSHKIIDVYDDVEFAGMHKVASRVHKELSGFNLLSQGEVDRLHDDFFGLVCMDKKAHKVRRYPMHDRPHTWLSAQYFDKTASALPQELREKVASRLRIACNRFDIKDYPKSLETCVFQKSASKNKTYALRSEYPIDSAQEVKLAAGYFSKYASQFTDPKDRNIFASNVLNRANELNVNIQDNHKEGLEKFASTRFNPYIDHALNERKMLVSSNERSVEFLEKLATARKTASPQKVADLLYEFDKKAGVSKYWDSKIKDPYQAVMGVEKTASHRFNIGDGTMTDKDLINVLNDKKAEQYLGKAVIEAAKKNPIAIFESLPKPNKEVLYNIYKKVL